MKGKFKQVRETTEHQQGHKVARIAVFPYLWVFTVIRATMGTGTVQVLTEESSLPWQGHNNNSNVPQ
jgi:hypothetical protein